MEIIVWIIIVIYVLYWEWMGVYFNEENENECVSSLLNMPSVPLFSIIICARNEEKYLRHFFDTLLSQKNISQLAEIIFVNDASEDNTLIIAQNILSKHNISYKIINNTTRCGKKQSIEAAINQSHPKSEYLIFRDADTYTLSNDWFFSFSCCVHHQPDLVIAPVVTEISRPSVADYFQYYEGMALMYLTLGSLNKNHPILCSAANLMVKKSTFKALNPYQDNYSIYSGDDIFLLNKIREHKGVIKAIFNNKSIVYTYTPHGIKNILKQKFRWFSKISVQPDKLNILSALMIGMVNLMLLLIGFYSFRMFLIVFFIKIISDLRVVYAVQKKLQLGQKLHVYFFIAELLYIPYVWALLFKTIFSKKFK